MEESQFPADEDELQQTFERATEFVTYNASVMQHHDLLYLYSRYKQVNFGACKVPMPGILKFKSRSKWSAWHELGDMSKEDAMTQYIDKVSQLSPDWDINKPKDTVKKKYFGPVNSSCLNTDPELKEEAKTVFDFVKEGNLNQLEQLFLNNTALKDSLDEDGLSLLHWACDRGQTDIAKFLISVGSDINFQDKDGQTPLHYASSCGHEDVINLLLKEGASVNVFDSDGLSPADVAYSTSVKEILIARAV